MAESSFNCSVYQGFNFQKDGQELVGHLVSLTIGDEEMTADMDVTDPTSANMSEYVKVVGVISKIYWNGGYADPIQLAFQVSTAVKNKVAMLQHQSLSNTEVVMKFNIYDYDPDAKMYYLCFHSDDTDLKGLIMKSGGDLAINIDMDQSMEVVSPKNYTMSLGVMPQPESQDIHLAVSNTDKFVKKWGVTVG
ncbi:hypothetical protein LZ24_02704 [Desulfobotulus alkaliphilus]|uniref:Uncharacterized protein n=1 Tax=Desulfobotulus alkaliphilus TaxID=622671 RepID=A0A562RFD8_9BACT|nr:hypothetical protein [Desulfobotulus alkaliphilus]TWI66665.1 hypothetical protein LZ24_02888 [Desulfobotulus alkaliphilus]TWI67775.1 hypothetical protein LZ24_02704 [Desulfobotulus alkaliphilus]